MKEAAVRIVVAGCLVLMLGGCGKSGGFLSDDDAPATTTLAASAPALPGGPTVAELEAGVKACDAGTPRSVAFAPLPRTLSLGDTLGADSSPLGLSADVVPGRTLLRGGEPIGTVLAASTRDATLRAQYLEAVAQQAQGQGYTVRQTLVAGHPAIGFRSQDGSTIALFGTCRVWTVTADRGATARGVAKALISGEAG